MKIINQFRRKARVVESTTDMKQVAVAAQQQAEYYTPISEDEYPVILTISVQIKVCFVWVTVWAESCDVSDGDTRPHIEKRARRLLRILEGKENGQSEQTPGMGAVRVIPRNMCLAGGGAVSNQSK